MNQTKKMILMTFFSQIKCEKKNDSIESLIDMKN